MDKYELVLKVEEIRRLANQKQYKKAIKILETIDVNKRRVITELSIYADVYAHNGKLEEAKDILLRIYDKSNTKRIIYKIIDLSIKLSEIDDAEEFFLEYLEISNNDPSQYILRYRIDKLKGVDINKQIETLIKYKEYEYEEKWALELAKLYHKAGEKDKCIKECEQIMLWFGEGVYVEQAKALKTYYTGEQFVGDQPFDNQNSEYDTSEIYTVYSMNNKLEDNSNFNNEVVEEEKVINLSVMSETESKKESSEGEHIREVGSYNDQEDMQILLNSLQDMEVSEEYNSDENLILSDELDYNEEQRNSENLEHNEDQKSSENLEYNEDQKSSENLEHNKEQNYIEELEPYEEQDFNKEIKVDDGRNISNNTKKIDSIYQEKTIESDNKKNQENQENQEITSNQFFGAGLFLKNLVGLKKTKEKKISIEDKIQDMFHAASQLTNGYDNQETKNLEEPSNNDVNLDHLDKILEVNKPDNSSNISINQMTNQKDNDQEDKDQEDKDQEDTIEVSKDAVDLTEEELTDDAQDDKEHMVGPKTNDSQTIETENCDLVENDIDTSIVDLVVDDNSSEDRNDQETEDNSVNILLTDMDKEPNILPDDDIIINNIKLNQIFYSFIKIPSVKEYLCRYIIEIASSKVSINFVITGTKSSGKTELGKMISKALYKLKVIRTPRIAKITAVKLNKIDLFSQKENLIDGCVIIEKASELNSEMIQQIITLIKEYESRISVILEDTKENMDNLFNKYHELNDMFHNKIDLPMYKGEDLIEFAKNYLMKLEYEIDSEAWDILVSIADNIDKECNEEGRLIAMLECIDYAKGKCDIRNRDYLMKMVSSGKYNESDLCMIRAIDFTE